jgi:hypothetical protein
MAVHIEEANTFKEKGDDLVVVIPFQFLYFSTWTRAPVPDTLFYFLPMNQKISDRTMLMRMLVAIGK